MDYVDVTHIAVSVAGDLESAERYYCELFDLRVAWREPVPGDAPFTLSREELSKAGVIPEIAMLANGAFRLTVVSSEDAVSPNGLINHIGLQVSEAQLIRVRQRVREQSLQVVAEREDELFDFIDAHGVEWELDTRSFADPLAIVLQKRQREAQRTANG